MPERYRITRAARTDLDAIWRYGAENHSVDQAMAYDEAMHEAFDRLADFPGLGRGIEASAQGTRLAFEGAHVILYRPAPAPLTILRIAHQSSDWASLLESD